MYKCSVSISYIMCYTFISLVSVEMVPLAIHITVWLAHSSQRQLYTVPVSVSSMLRRSWCSATCQTSPYSIPAHGLYSHSLSFVVGHLVCPIGGPWHAILRQHQHKHAPLTPVTPASSKLYCVISQH